MIIGQSTKRFSHSLTKSFFHAVHRRLDGCLSKLLILDFFIKTRMVKSDWKREYEKNREDIYETLRPYLNDAIRNAKKLDESNRYKTPANAAHGTKVYELLELLRPYLDT